LGESSGRQGHQSVDDFDEVGAPHVGRIEHPAASGGSRCADVPGEGAAMFDVRDIRRVDGALVLVTYRGDW
jgi:hypothetical protein